MGPDRNSGTLGQSNDDNFHLSRAEIPGKVVPRENLGGNTINTTFVRNVVRQETASRKVQKDSIPLKNSQLEVKRIPHYEEEPFWNCGRDGNNQVQNDVGNRAFSNGTIPRGGRRSHPLPKTLAVTGVPPIKANFIMDKQNHPNMGLPHHLASFNPQGLVDLSQPPPNIIKEMSDISNITSKEPPSNQAKEECVKVSEPLPSDINPNAGEVEKISTVESSGKKSISSEQRAAKADAQTAWSLLHEYWTFVQENPYDFDGWSYLLSHVESMKHIEAARSAFEGFLPLYPYCFAYWKKLAEVELKHSTLQRCIGVLIYGTQSIPLCHEVWISMFKHFIKYTKQEGISSDIVRGMYAMGLERIGYSWHSSPFWEVCIKYEMDNGNLPRAMAIYKSVIKIPNKVYNKHWDQLIALIRDNQPQALLTPEEYDSLYKICCNQLKGKSTLPQTLDPENKLKVDNEIATLIKEKLLASLIKTHEQTVKEADKRWKYELKIKRPYFHVKPLESKQLKSWNDYLDFEIRQGDPVRILILFERCLISCAQYEEMWCRYAAYIEQHAYNVAKGKYEGIIYKPGCFASKEEKTNATDSGSTTKEAKEKVETDSSVKTNNDDKNGAINDDEKSSCSTITDSDEDFYTAVMKDDIMDFDVSPETKASLSSLVDTLCDGIGVGGRVLMCPSLTPSWILQEVTYEDVRQIFRRAAWIHCPSKPLLLMQWAEFEEFQGDVQTARELLNTVLVKHPLLLKARLQIIELERRNGMIEHVEKHFAQTFSAFADPKCRSLIAIRYARFLFKIKGQNEAPLVILRKALKKDKGNIHLYQHVFDICYQRFPVDCNGVLAAVMLALASKELSSEEKYDLCLKRGEFLKEHGTITQIKEARVELSELKSRLDIQKAEELKKEKERKKMEEKEEEKKKLEEAERKKLKEKERKEQEAEDDKDKIKTSNMVDSPVGTKGERDDYMCSEKGDYRYLERGDYRGSERRDYRGPEKGELSRDSRRREPDRRRSDGIPRRHYEFSHRRGRRRDRSISPKLSRNLHRSFGVSTPHMDMEQNNRLSPGERDEQDDSHHVMPKRFNEIPSKKYDADQNSTKQDDFLPPPPIPQGILGESLFNQGKVTNVGILTMPENMSQPPPMTVPPPSNRNVSHSEMQPVEKVNQPPLKPAPGFHAHHEPRFDKPSGVNLVPEIMARLGPGPPIEVPPGSGSPSQGPPRGIHGDFPGKRMAQPHEGMNEPPPKMRHIEGPPLRNPIKNPLLVFNPTVMNRPPFSQNAQIMPIQRNLNSNSPFVNVPEWLVKEGGELRLSNGSNGEAVIRYWPCFMNEVGHDTLFDALRKVVKWFSRKIRLVNGTWVDLPMLVSWLGPCDYRKNGMSLSANTHWPPEMVDLLHILIRACKMDTQFNSCLLRLYRNGFDHSPWDSEEHAAMNTNPKIATISVGSRRTIEMRHKNGPEYLRFPLLPGSLLFMEGATQSDWIHQIPKDPETPGESISLSFRTMLMIKGLTV